MNMDEFSRSLDMDNLDATVQANGIAQKPSKVRDDLVFMYYLENRLPFPADIAKSRNPDTPEGRFQRILDLCYQDCFFRIPGVKGNRRMCLAMVDGFAAAHAPFLAIVTQDKDATEKQMVPIRERLEAETGLDLSKPAEPLARVRSEDIVVRE